MWRKLEHTVKDESTTLKEAVAPVPAVILDYMVRFRLDPKVECDKDDTTNPAAMARWASHHNHTNTEAGKAKLTGAHERTWRVLMVRGSRQMRTNKMTGNR